jgi:hypothetical protein
MIEQEGAFLTTEYDTPAPSVPTDPMVLRAWAHRRDAALTRAADTSHVVAWMATAGAPLPGVMRLSRCALAALETAQLAGVMAGGNAKPLAPRETEEDGYEPLEIALRQLVVTCCIRGTVELAVAADERKAADTDVAAMLRPIEAELTELTAAGWSLLRTLRATISEEVRATVSAHLVYALGELFEEVLEGPVRWIGTDAAQRRRGIPDDTRHRSIAIRTVEDTIVPRLEEIGLPAMRAWRRARMAA